MRWYRALTYKRVQVGIDETRNPVFELQDTGESILVRTALYAPTTLPTATSSTWFNGRF